MSDDAHKVIEACDDRLAMEIFTDNMVVKVKQLKHKEKAVECNDSIVCDDVGVSDKYYETCKICSQNIFEPLKAKILQDYCSVCKIRGKLVVCGNCLDTIYCSIKCQNRDWNKHKKICAQSTGLNNACQNSKHGSILLFLSRGASPNKLNRDGFTPLHIVL